MQIRAAFLLLILFLIAPITHADQKVETPPEKDSKNSPWLIVPLLTNSPKLGTSAGVLGGYLHQFDEDSPTSLFGATGSYSNTDSVAIAAFAQMYFDQDKQRLLLGAFHGEVNNEYADYLGTGYAVKTTDTIYALFARYLYRLKANWFLGPQVVSTNYAISGGDFLSNQFLEHIGLTGFSSNGIGLVGERDTRDNQNSPASGSVINFNNVAYRESFGGDYSFDAYSLTAKKYIGHGKSNVLASRIEGRWTNDAPAGGYSTVRLRGYTMGQYLAPNSTLIELEERFVIKNRWGGDLFAGAACLYGDGMKCFDKENIYPSIGAGITYMLKVKEKMIVRAEAAKGKDENYGLYLKFGYEF